MDGLPPRKRGTFLRKRGLPAAKAMGLSQEEGPAPRESGGYRLFFVIGVWLAGGNEDLEEKLWPKPQYSR